MAEVIHAGTVNCPALMRSPHTKPAESDTLPGVNPLEINETPVMVTNPFGSPPLHQIVAPKLCRARCCAILPVDASIPVIQPP